MSLYTSVADQQIAAATIGTLSFQYADSDGEPADPGTVTVAVVNSAGTTITPSAVAGTGTDPRTCTLTVAQTATIDQLTVTWTASGTVIGTTVVDIIGRPLLTRAEYIDREARGASIELDVFVRARREVDDKFRDECDRSFVPRFDVIDTVFSHRGTAVLGVPDLRSVRWASSVDTDGTLTTLDVTGIQPDAAGIIRTSRWSCGHIRVGVVHGMDRPPHDVIGAAARYLRDVVSVDKSQIPARATSYADGSGGTTQLATPGLGPFITGIPEVDQVLTARKWYVPGIA